MRSDGAGNNRDDVRQDRVWPEAVRWDLGMARQNVSEVLWRCNALRAGKLYSRSLFGTREEAEAFVERMQHAEPDQMFSVEEIKANAVWN